MAWFWKHVIWQHFLIYKVEQIKASQGSQKEIEIFSIGIPHTRKSLVKGERFMRYEWRIWVMFRKSLIWLTILQTLPKAFEQHSMLGLFSESLLKMAPVLRSASASETFRSKFCSASQGFLSMNSHQQDKVYGEPNSAAICH